MKGIIRKKTKLENMESVIPSPHRDPFDVSAVKCHSVARTFIVKIFIYKGSTVVATFWKKIRSNFLKTVTPTFFSFCYQKFSTFALGIKISSYFLFGHQKFSAIFLVSKNLRIFSNWDEWTSLRDDRINEKKLDETRWSSTKLGLLVTVVHTLEKFQQILKIKKYVSQRFVWVRISRNGVQRVEKFSSVFRKYSENYKFFEKKFYYQDVAYKILRIKAFEISILCLNCITFLSKPT